MYSTRTHTHSPYSIRIIFFEQFCFLKDFFRFFFIFRRNWRDIRWGQRIFMEIKRENDRKLRFDGHGMAWLWFVVGWMYYELRFRDVDSMLQIKSYPTTKLSDWQNGEEKKRNTKRTPQFCSPNQIEKWSEKKSKTEKGAKKSESKQKSCTSQKIYDIHIVSLKNDHKYLALQEYQLLLYGMEYKKKKIEERKRRERKELAQGIAFSKKGTLKPVITMRRDFFLLRVRPHNRIH